jgi:hypothetical protein
MKSSQPRLVPMTKETGQATAPETESTETDESSTATGKQPAE